MMKSRKHNSHSRGVDLQHDSDITIKSMDPKVNYSREKKDYGDFHIPDKFNSPHKTSQNNPHHISFDKLDNISWSDISKINFPNSKNESKRLLKSNKSKNKGKSRSKFSKEMEKSKEEMKTPNSRSNNISPKYPLEFDPGTPQTPINMKEHISNFYSNSKILSILNTAFQELATDNLLHTLGLDETSKQFISDRIVEVIQNNFSNVLQEENFTINKRMEKLTLELGKMDHLAKELAKANDKLVFDLKKKEKEIRLAKKTVIDMNNQVSSLKGLISSNDKNSDIEVFLLLKFLFREGRYMKS